MSLWATVDITTLLVTAWLATSLTNSESSSLKTLRGWLSWLKSMLPPLLDSFVSPLCTVVELIQCDRQLTSWRYSLPRRSPSLDQIIVGRFRRLPHTMMVVCRIYPCPVFLVCRLHYLQGPHPSSAIVDLPFTREHSMGPLLPMWTVPQWAVNSYSSFSFLRTNCNPSSRPSRSSLSYIHFLNDMPLEFQSCSPRQTFRSGDQWRYRSP